MSDERKDQRRNRWERKRNYRNRNKRDNFKKAIKQLDRNDWFAYSQEESQED